MKWAKHKPCYREITMIPCNKIIPAGLIWGNKVNETKSNWRIEMIKTTKIFKHMYYL